ncbi:hypothetical protein JCM30237_10880 [Halolamina litorea]|uniref:Type IV secretion system protein TrbL n=1 Tax=Halolamina litorea TaxID=1515593 RepID=A0ABD6BW11_9EURY|nr:hypothetical protein [Halolamina litorea]
MSSFWDAFVDAISEFLRLLFAPVESFVETFGNELIHLVVGTPAPNAVFTAPTNGPWPAIYDYYWSAIIPLSLSLYGLMLGIVIFLESTSYLFGSYHRSKLKKRAFTGLLGILSWWWVSALALRFVDALTGFIVPDLSEIALFETASFAILGVLGVMLAQGVNLTLFLLLALVYTIRQLGIYLFVLLMPLLMVFWIPGVGPFTLVSRFMQRLAGFYVPLLFLTVPVALLLRLGELLGDSFSLSLGGVGAWLLALLIPVAALFAPLVMFWQAGALFFFADRASRHVSVDRAQRRVSRMRAGSEQATHSGRNFGRGVLGKPAVNRDNQQLLDASRSRAHRAGTRVENARGRLQSAFTERSNSGSDGDAGGTSGGDDAAESESTTDTKQSARSENFETLRRRDSAPAQTDDADDESTDDDPRYIQ